MLSYNDRDKLIRAAQAGWIVDPSSLEDHEVSSLEDYGVDHLEHLLFLFLHNLVIHYGDPADKAAIVYAWRADSDIRQAIQDTMSGTYSQHDWTISKIRLSEVDDPQEIVSLIRLAPILVDVDKNVRKLYGDPRFRKVVDQCIKFAVEAGFMGELTTTVMWLARGFKEDQTPKKWQMILRLLPAVFLLRRNVPRFLLPPPPGMAKDVIPFLNLVGYYPSYGGYYPSYGGGAYGGRTLTWAYGGRTLTRTERCVWLLLNEVVGESLLSLSQEVLENRNALTSGEHYSQLNKTIDDLQALIEDASMLEQIACDVVRHRGQITLKDLKEVIRKYTKASEYRSLDRHAQRDPAWAIKQDPAQFKVGKGLGNLYLRAIAELDRAVRAKERFPYSRGTRLVIHGRDGEMLYLLIRKLNPELAKHTVFVLSPRALTDSRPKEWLEYLKRVIPPKVPQIHVDTGFAGTIPRWFKRSGWNVRNIYLLSTNIKEFGLLPESTTWHKDARSVEFRRKVIDEIEHAPQRLEALSGGDVAGKVRSTWGSWAYSPDAPGFWARYYGILDDLGIPKTEWAPPWDVK